MSLDKREEERQLADKTKPVDDRGMTRIFVYGSLKDEHPNNTILKREGAKFLGYDSITDFLEMIDLGAFPAVMESDPKKPKKKIFGQVWGTNEAGLEAVDYLEGHPEWYQRRKIWTDGVGGEQKRVWIYVLPQEWRDSRSVVEPALWHPFPKERNFWRAHNISV